MKSIRIGDRLIGKDKPVFIIAEAGINHNGDLKTAKALIKTAKECGADAVKFQSFKASNLVSKSDPNFKRIKGLQLTDQNHVELYKYAHKIGIAFFSTPFDKERVDFLDRLGVKVFKIASCDITNRSLLEHVAKKGKPIILSTGMSTISEIDYAVDVIKSNGNKKIILLHCVSLYPTPPELVNLKTISFLRDRYNTIVGFSDHSMETLLPAVSIAFGARVIEKHFTLDKKLKGYDHKMSITPGGFKTMVHNIREVESSMGVYTKPFSKQEQAIGRIMRRSLVWTGDYSKGTKIISEMLDALRPGTGISPNMATSIIGKRLNRDVRPMAQVKTKDYS